MIKLLKAVSIAVTLLDKGNNFVSIENWSGRDSVTQLVTLIQLCMDPFYRTITGFCVLIEKEWMSYGKSEGGS